MDFKLTKVTAPPNIAERWRKWVRACTTEKPSAEFSLRKQKSSAAELFVADFLKRSGWQVLEHDVEVHHIQVDLLVRSPDGVLTIVEVKMQNAFGVAHVTPAQGRRLARVAQFLAEFEPVQMRVAFVEKQRVSLLPVDGLTGF